MTEVLLPSSPLEKNALRDDVILAGSGDRLTKYQKERIRNHCWQRDTGHCGLCHLPLEGSNGNQAHIHHRDGHATNNHASNLCLAHPECHYKENARVQAIGVQAYHTQLEKEMNVGPRVPTENNAVAVSSKILDLNIEYEPLFRRAVFEDMKEAIQKGETRSRAELRINARAYCGCSLQSSYSYIEPMFASRGPLQELIDMGNGLPYVRFRDKSEERLSIEELEKRYPKEGLRLGRN